RFAAVTRIPVAIGKTRGTERRAQTAGAARRAVPVQAALLAAAAMLRVGAQIRFAAVRRIAVAIGLAARALTRAARASGRARPSIRLLRHGKILRRTAGRPGNREPDRRAHERQPAPG